MELHSNSAFPTIIVMDEWGGTLASIFCYYELPVANFVENEKILLVNYAAVATRSVCISVELVFV